MVTRRHSLPPSSPPHTFFFSTHLSRLGPAPLLQLEVRSFIGAFKLVNKPFFERVCANLLACGPRPAFGLLARHIAAGKAFGACNVQVVRTFGHAADNLPSRPPNTLPPPPLFFTFLLPSPPGPHPPPLEGVGRGSATCLAPRPPRGQVLSADGHSCPWHACAQPPELC